MWEEATRKEGVTEEKQRLGPTGSLTEQSSLSKFSGNVTVV